MQNDNRPQEYQTNTRDFNPELSGIEPTSPIYVQPDPPKKKRSKKIIAAIVLGVLIIAGVGGYFAYTQLASGNDTETASASPSPEPKPQASKAPDVAAMVASVREKLADVPATKDAYASVSHKAPGGYWVRVDGDNAKDRVAFIALSYPDVKANRTDLSTVKKALGDEGIKKVVDTGDATDEAANYQGHFASDAIACSVTNGGRGDIDSASNTMKYTSYILTLGCAKTVDFADAIAAIKPFASEIKKGSLDSSNTDLVLFDPVVTKSPVKGYAHASVGVGGILAYVGGYQALLYQIPDGSWHYFLGTQNSLMCSEFNTVDIKRAFAGYECYEGETVTKVVAP